MFKTDCGYEIINTAFIRRSAQYERAHVLLESDIGRLSQTTCIVYFFPVNISFRLNQLLFYNQGCRESSYTALKPIYPQQTEIVEFYNFSTMINKCSAKELLMIYCVSKFFRIPYDINRSQYFLNSALHTKSSLLFSPGPDVFHFPEGVPYLQ